MRFPIQGFKHRGRRLAAAALVAVVAVACDDDEMDLPDPERIAEGQDIFRNDTFGDEQQWTDRLRMHEVIASAVDPTTALSVGLKVDSEMVPPQVLATADLRSPATTVALLKLGAVVGLKGTVVTEGGQDRLVSVGTTCALCHSTVDNSVMPGIGRRLDGWPNRDLDPGAIIALSPAVPEEAKAVYRSWGPGRYDPRFNIDGQNRPVMIPPAYGLQDVPLATYTGDGDISYWNAYVAVTQMGGKGVFSDPRIGVERTLPAGAPDEVTPKLTALRDYQLSLPAPAPPAGSFDATAAARGRDVFEGAGRCASCHQGDRRTESNLHAPAEVGSPAAYVNRSATKRLRTTPLRGLWHRAPYFHDGSAATLEAVVDRYVQVFGLNLTPGQRTDLVEYLKSL